MKLVVAYGGNKPRTGVSLKLRQSGIRGTDAERSLIVLEDVSLT